jgi:hypothetical protein
MTMLTVTSASVSRVSEFGQILADGIFAGEYTTNLVIPCRNHYARTALELIASNQGAPVAVELDGGGNVSGVYEMWIPPKF